MKKKFAPVIIVLLFLIKTVGCYAQQPTKKAEMPGPLIVLSNNDVPKKVWITIQNPDKKASKIYQLYFSGSYIGNNTSVSLFIGDNHEDPWISIKKSLLDELGLFLSNDETPFIKFYLPKGEYFSYGKLLRVYNTLGQMVTIKIELKEGPKKPSGFPGGFLFLKKIDFYYKNNIMK